MGPAPSALPQGDVTQAAAFAEVVSAWASDLPPTGDQELDDLILQAAGRLPALEDAIASGDPGLIAEARASASLASAAVYNHCIAALLRSELADPQWPSPVIDST